MEFPPEVWLNILEYTNVPRDVKEFTSMRSVCRMFCDLCVKVGAPIDRSYETMQALSPVFAQTSNYMSLKKPLTKDLVVPERIRRLKFVNSGDPNLTIGGDYLDYLEVTGFIDDRKHPCFLPKLRFRKITRIRLGDFKMTEDTFLSSMFVEDLWIDRCDVQVCAVLFASAFAQNLRKLRFSYFQCPRLTANLFSNLVIIASANLKDLTLDHLPKVMLLEQCKLRKSFFNKPCSVLSKDRETGEYYHCIEEDRFYAEMKRYYVIPLCNFDIRNVHLLPKESFSIIVDGIRDEHVGRLVGWMRYTDEKKNSSLEINRGYFGVKRNILEKRTRKQLSWIKITNV
ncbi:Hypothetical protein with Leucine-rich repeat [Cedratvirus A11]|uniref:F-box domain-containing protein n=1 Tax=Cedratvirus A11 TaxID=1903266 RepID=A0A1M7XUF8_9VIRU|nr:Hypothetical protein with Leucine-rich repeat [Cedratvirus A11]SHO33336.1 Hypothetical protein with Leucine-rich repeat [Cedratvirus A11]